LDAQSTAAVVATLPIAGTKLFEGQRQAALTLPSTPYHMTGTHAMKSACNKHRQTISSCPGYIIYFQIIITFQPPMPNRHPIDSLLAHKANSL
jgi:hypothetical protein